MRVFLLGKAEPEVAGSGAALEEPGQRRKGGDGAVVFKDASGVRDRSASGAGESVRLWSTRQASGSSEGVNSFGAKTSRFLHYLENDFLS
jgi:hypothetical protein